MSAIGYRFIRWLPFHTYDTFFPNLQMHVSGLEDLHNITKNKQCKLRIEMGGYDSSSAWAEYRFC